MRERVEAGALCALSLSIGFFSPVARATTLNASDSQWKNNPAVSTTAVPRDSTFAGTIGGHVDSKVYRNTETGNLGFDYQFFRDVIGSSNIVRATMGGHWPGIGVFNVGADATGTSGSEDASAEWSDGDPLHILRDPSLQSPETQWRSSGIGTLLGTANSSSHIFFETSARSYELAGASMIASNSNSSTATILAPSQVPEPAGLLLALVSCGLLMSGRRRKRTFVPVWGLDDRTSSAQPSSSPHPGVPGWGSLHTIPFS